MGAVVSGEMIGWLAFWAGACGGGRGAKSVDPEVLIQLGEGFNSRESSDVYLDSPKVKTSDGLITEGWWGGGRGESAMALSGGPVFLCAANVLETTG